MIEVEVKAKIDNFEDMRKKLNNLGAIKTKEEFQEDIYFNSPIVTYASSESGSGRRDPSACKPNRAKRQSRSKSDTLRCPQADNPNKFK